MKVEFVVDFVQADAYVFTSKIFSIKECKDIQRSN